MGEKLVDVAVEELGGVATGDRVRLESNADFDESHIENVGPDVNGPQV